LDIGDLRWNLSKPHATHKDCQETKLHRKGAERKGGKH
jgi:hypothetical protein